MNKKYIPLLLILILLVCIITGIIISNKYLDDNKVIVEDVMTRAYKRPCYTNGYPLYSKIKLLAEQIDAGFNTVNSDTIEYWEKFIT